MVKNKWLDFDGNPLPCFEGGCETPSKVRGLCRYHYKRHHYHKSVPVVPCLSVECGNEVAAHGMCLDCLGPSLDPNMCFVPECTGKPSRVGLCSYHYGSGWYDPKLGENQPHRPCSRYDCDRGRPPSGEFCRRCDSVRFKFGLTKESLRWFLSEENMVCRNQACGSTEDLHMDHDHSCCPPGTFTFGSQGSCGKCVRGWLCRPCNVSLGFMKDDKELMLGLVEALDNWAVPTEIPQGSRTPRVSRSNN